MNWIPVEPAEIAADGCCTLRDRRARHIRDVLRAAAGATVRVAVIRGPRGSGTVEETGRAHVRLRCAFDATAPAPPRVDLLLAMPRPKVMKRLWAPLASLGIRRIVITNAARVERFYFDTHWLDETAYRPLLIEGLAQSGETWLPEVHVALEFKPLIQDRLDQLCPETIRLAGDPAAGERLARLSLPLPRRVLLAIGPEGGWTPYELDLLAAHGFRSVRTGGGPLRSDVACIALLALVKECLFQA